MGEFNSSDEKTSGEWQRERESFLITASIIKLVFSLHVNTVNAPSESNYSRKNEGKKLFPPRAQPSVENCRSDARDIKVMPFGATNLKGVYSTNMKNQPRRYVRNLCSYIYTHIYSFGYDPHELLTPRIVSIKFDLKIEDFVDEANLD